MDISRMTSDKKKYAQNDLLTAELKKGFEWTTTHSKIVGFIVGALILVGGGWTLVTMMNESKEKELQAQYFDLENQTNKKRAAFEAGRNPIPPNPEQPTAVAPQKATGDLTKDYGDLVNQLSVFAKEHPGSVAGSMAALNLASLQSEYKQNEQAIETLKLVKPQKGFLGALVQMELATQLANAGQCPEATKIWSALSTQDSANFLKGEAKLKMGLCAESQGDLTQAQSLYKEVETEFKESAAGRSAAQYLRLLSAKTAAAVTN